MNDEKEDIDAAREWCSQDHSTPSDEIKEQTDWDKIQFDPEYREEGENPSMEPMCGRCYAEGVELFKANCAEKPERLIGEPMGMYHCPDCGAMILAGIPHPDMCKQCIERVRPGFDTK